MAVVVLYIQLQEPQLCMEGGGVVGVVRRHILLLEEEEGQKSQVF